MLMTTRWHLLCFGTAFFASTSLTQAQDKTNQVPVKGTFHEVGKVEITDSRLTSLRLPPGFRINIFAEITNPRVIAAADDGTVYVSQREAGSLSMLRDTDGDGVADLQKVLVQKEQLHGLALHGNQLYFTTIKEVYRADRMRDGSLGIPQTLITDLPDAGQHPNRVLAFGPDGMLYISVGSTTNAAVENNPENATLLRALPDGTRRTIFASGLRNTIGFGWHPVSKRLYGFDHGIDWLGEDDPLEELNEIKEGAKYGWPFVYNKSKIYPHLQVPPKLGKTKEDWARESSEPVLMYRAHAAPLQWIFYTGIQFPEEYRNDAFVTMRGSWNRKPASGYEVVRVRFNPDGTPKEIVPFLSGFLTKDAKGEEVQFGRPVGIAQLPDGSLLVGDDTNNTIYRISYAGGQNPAPPETRREFTLSRALSSTLLKSPSGMDIRSDAFTNEGEIPLANTSYGEKKSPGLTLSGVPDGAKSLVLIMEDPDALNPKPTVHWLIANLPSDLKEIPADLPKADRPTALRGGIQGGTTPGIIGYYGPQPPPQDPAHRYHFQLFALDTLLDLQPGYNRAALLKAMRGHVLRSGVLVGKFKREG